uniref:Uncharacterized protein n=1 Tax=Tanacetum cinerariifolium TaxID=118510 RepID=A0A6L2M5Y0_TANCI|nr:hypothetical protein [Tanacetum cinerariifolium]
MVINMKKGIHSSGRKSVPGMNSHKKGKWKENTTRSSRELHATAPTADLLVIHDDTPLIPTDTPTISPIVPTIPSIAPTIQYTSLFVCTDSSDSDTLDTPPSPIHDTPPADISPSIHQILPPNGVLMMLTAKKRVRPLPTHRLALRYLADYSSSDHFTLDDSSRDSPSDSSLETSSDSHSDTSSDSSSRHSFSSHPISDSPYDSSTATFAGLSQKRRRSPTTSVPAALPVPRALSPVRADLLPPLKRIRDFNSVTDFEVCSEEGFVPQTRPMKYSELTKAQQLQDECDVPPDAYAFVNHQEAAKDI